MALLAVVVLVVLGAAMTAFGIVALRDEPPRWTLRVRRPGRVLFLGLAALLAAFVVNSRRYDIDEEVGAYIGQHVDCQEIGRLEIEGERRQVYSCVASESEDARVGCYARVGDDVMEVTRRVETPGAFGGRTPDC